MKLIANRWPALLLLWESRCRQRRLLVSEHNIRWKSCGRLAGTIGRKVLWIRMRSVDTLVVDRLPEVGLLILIRVRRIITLLSNGPLVVNA